MPHALRLAYIAPRKVAAAQARPSNDATAAAAAAENVAVASRGLAGYEEVLQRNWTGNVSFAPSTVRVPSTVDALRRVVLEAPP